MNTVEYHFSGRQESKVDCADVSLSPGFVLVLETRNLGASIEDADQPKQQKETWHSP